jgi:hypothetical protein
MGAIGRLRTVANGHMAYCPGCKEYHKIPDTWVFNGSYTNPTFTPSILTYGETLERGEWRCHSYITDGEWIFLGDCSHDLKGQKVRLRDESDSFPLLFGGIELGENNARSPHC